MPNAKGKGDDYQGGGGGRELWEFMAPRFTLVQGLGKACVGNLSG